MSNINCRYRFIAAILCVIHPHFINSFIYQYPLHFADQIFYNILEWQSIYSSNCEFIESFINTEYGMDISNITCFEFFNVPSDALYHGYSSCIYGTEDYQCGSFSIHITNNTFFNESNDLNEQLEYSMFLFFNKISNSSLLTKYNINETVNDLFIYSTVYQQYCGWDVFGCINNISLINNNDNQCTFGSLTLNQYQSSGIYSLFPSNNDSSHSNDFLFGVIKKKGSDYDHFHDIMFCVKPSKYELLYLSTKSREEQFQSTIYYGLDDCQTEISFDNSKYAEFSANKKITKNDDKLILDINDDSALSNKIESISKILGKYFVDLYDIFIIVCGCVTNVISLIFIMIGLQHYENVIGFEENNIIHWVFIYIGAMIYMLLSSLAAYINYADCTSSPIQWTNFKEFATFTIISLLFLAGLFIVIQRNKLCKTCIEIKGNRWIPVLIVWCVAVVFHILYIKYVILESRFAEYSSISYWFSSVFASATMTACAAQIVVKKMPAGNMLPIVQILVYLAFIAAVSLFHINSAVLTVFWGAFIMQTAYSVLFHIGMCGLIFKSLWIQSILLVFMWVMCLYLYFTVGIWIQVIFMIFYGPIFIITLFMAKKELNSLNPSSLISIYLIIFDLSTDFYLSYLWFVDGNIWWSVLNILLFINGVLSSIFVKYNNNNDDILVDNKNKKWYEYILQLCGLGRPYYSVKSWTETENQKDYTKIELNEIMYNSLPSIILQIFIVSTNSKYSTQTIQSITVTLLSVSWEMFTFIIDIITPNLNQEEQDKEMDLVIDDILVDNDNDNIINNDNNNIKPKPQRCTFCANLRKDGKLFIALYLFLLSDFFLRTFPFINIILYFHLEVGIVGQVVFCLIYFIIFAIIEYKFNYLMRISQFKSNKVILSVFLVSIYSSFYNLLCCLSSLQSHNWFAKSVIFHQFKKEHMFRLFISSIIVIISLSLISSIQHEHDKQQYVDITILFVVMFVVLLIINWITIRIIAKSQINIDNHDQKGINNGIHDEIELNEENKSTVTK